LIKRAVGYGFSVEDIGKMVGDTGLTTCNDVYRIAAQRLEQLRCDRDNVRASSLKALIGTCAQRGSGRDCRILIALAKPDPEKWGTTKKSPASGARWWAVREETPKTASRRPSSGPISSAAEAAPRDRANDNLSARVGLLLEVRHLLP